MSIARRITLFSSLWLLVLLIVVNSGIYLLFGQMTARAELERVGLQTQTIAETIRPDRLGVGNPGDILRAYTPSNGIIRVINEDSQPFIEATKYPELREIPVTYSSKQETEQIRFADDRYVISRFPIIWSDGSVVTLEYSEQMVTYDSTMATLRLVLFIASISLLLPAIFAGRALSRIILLPIKTLTKTMENIRQDGTFERIQVPEQSKDELDQMGQTFNRMIELLEENYKKQQQFVSDASHELRTPLTVIESYTSLLKRWGKAKPELLEEAVEAIYEESGRMKGLTEQMLALAIGRNDQPTKLSEFELGKLVHDIAKRLEQTFNRKIHVNVNEHYFISADEAQIKQLIFILLENGLKYSDDSLSVDIVDEDREIRLDVRDKGIGIPENDLPYVFERFFRVDKARSRQTGGSGLGLAIAKSIIQAHSGEITVRSLENIGTTFTVILPKGNKSAKGRIMLESKRKWAFVSIAVVVLLIVVLILSFTRTGAEPLDEIEIRDLIEGQFGGSIQSIAQTNVNGKTVYEVELLEAAGLYQVIVDPTTGEILSLEHVLERGEVSVKPEESVVNTISVDEVEEKIEDSFGKNYSDLHINLGEKAGKLIYEITVSQENSYSDVEMDAQTGEILLITSRDKKERESETDSSQRAEVIGEQEAVRIALTHVAGTVDDVELDEEDGRLIYEIEIEVGDLEAEVYLDAFTGELITIKWED